MRLPGFGGGPKLPPATPPPTREDPAIAEAARQLRQSELRRRGRAASILTRPGGLLGAPPISRPLADTLG